MAVAGARRARRGNAHGWTRLLVHGKVPRLLRPLHGKRREKSQGGGSSFLSRCPSCLDVCRLATVTGTGEKGERVRLRSMVWRCVLVFYVSTFVWHGLVLDTVAEV